MTPGELVALDAVDRALRARDQQALTEAMRRIAPARRAQILVRTRLRLLPTADREWWAAPCDCCGKPD